MMSDQGLEAIFMARIEDLELQLEAAKCSNRLEAILPALAEYMRRQFSPHYRRCLDAECQALANDSASPENIRYWYLLTLVSWLSHASSAKAFELYLEGRANEQ
jgi:hypothetical protein